MTPREAGGAARTAGAECLMLTRFWPGNDRWLAVAAAHQEPSGKIMAADENLTLLL